MFMLTFELLTINGDIKNLVAYNSKYLFQIIFIYKNADVKKYTNLKFIFV
jgi:hypothetical protein